MFKCDPARNHCDFTTRFRIGTGAIEQIKKRFPRNDAWLERALPVRSDDALAEVPSGADLNRSSSSDEDFEEVRKAIFG